MLITDHHDLPESLPKALAITNPKLLPEGHPLSTLSGSGVAYKVFEELYTRFGRPEEVTRQLDLATLGLVADLARLTGDARYLVQRGLAALRNTQRLGLQTIMEIAELAPANLTEEHIGFVLGPRLNALGRLADANPAVELLTTSDPVRARRPGHAARRSEYPAAVALQPGHPGGRSPITRRPNPGWPSPSWSSASPPGRVAWSELWPAGWWNAITNRPFYFPPRRARRHMARPVRSKA